MKPQPITLKEAIVRSIGAQPLAVRTYTQVRYARKLSYSFNCTMVQRKSGDSWTIHIMPNTTTTLFDAD